MAFDSPQRILEHLKRFGQASVADLSLALGLTPVTIRHHLEALRSEKLIGDPKPRRKGRPGRPEMVYQLTARADGHMPRNYGELCGCLLEGLKTTRAMTPLPRALAAMGAELGERASLPGDAGSQKRLQAARAFLEDRGYFPGYTREGGSLKLTLANCPYLEAARETHALCLYDEALLNGLFGQEVRMAGHIVDREPVCTIVIG